MAGQNLPPKEVPVLSVETPARDILFYERQEAARYRENDNLPEFDTPHERVSQWPNHRLCGITADSEDGWLRFYYMATRSAQEAYNWQYAELLGNDRPELVQTWVVLRSQFVPGSLAAPPAMGRNWTFIGEEQMQLDERTSGLFVAVKHVWQDIDSPLSGERVDLETGALVPYSRQLVPAGTAGAAVDADGEFANVEPINRRWSMLSTERVAGLVGAAVKTRSYSVRDVAYWPPVLAYVELLVFPGPTPGSIAKIGANPVWKEWEYNGGCDMTITEGWSKTAPSLPAFSPLLTRPIQYDGALMRIQVEPCLHNGVWFREVNGSITDQLGIYEFFQQFPATEPPDWPATRVEAFRVTPLAGGYLTRSILIHRPARASRVNELILSVVDADLSSVDLLWDLTNLAPGSVLVEYRLDVATNPLFAGGFVSGFQNRDMDTDEAETVTGLLLNVVYYARVRAILSPGPVTVTSNTVVLLVRPMAALQAEQPSSTVIASGGTIAFGDVNISGSGALTITLRSVGNIDLTNLAVTKSGSGASLFTVGALSATTLDPAATATFTVTFAPGTIGAKTAALAIASNDETSPYVLNLTGSGVAPDLQVEMPLSTPLADGATLTFAATAIDADSKTIHLRNIGSTTLAISSLGGAALGYYDFSPYPFSATLAPGATSSLVITLPAGLPAGTYNYPLTIDSNDASTPFTLNLDGTVT